jgi:hypothetical protein
LYMEKFRPYAQGNVSMNSSDTLIIKVNGDPETSIGEKVPTES